MVNTEKHLRPESDIVQHVNCRVSIIMMRNAVRVRVSDLKIKILQVLLECEVGDGGKVGRVGPRGENAGKLVAAD